VVHVKDVSQAIHLSLHAPKLEKRVFNVGANEQNYKIEDLGKLIARHMPNVKLIIHDDSVDKRSYRVDFSLIREVLGFEAKYTVADAIAEFHDAFQQKIIWGMDQDIYYRVKYLKNSGGVKKIWEHHIRLR
jgi:nucleoside-diphosphate-sugar epimerase